MKVILSEDIKRLGKKFEVKEVKSGYARNFLIPKNLAVAATETSLRIISQQKAIWERQEKELIKQFKETANKLKDLVLDFPLKVGESGQVFGSVSASEIKKALENLGYQNFELVLEKPIKELGEYSVEVDLGQGIKTKIKIKVHSQP